MMWARLIGSVVFLAASLVGARSANESMTGLESCFQVARIADPICSKLPDPAQRLDCFQKTRSAQLECLEHVLSETPAEIPSAEKSNTPPKAVVRTGPPEPPESPEARTGAIRPGIPAKTADVPVRPTRTNWIVSETTSPIDYSPLVTALVRSTSPVKDAPGTFAVRCRGQHTELLVGTDGTWATTRGHELRIDYQINEQPAVGLPWILSSDGKTATYKEDPVGLLQSLPDDARLKINVADRSSSSHEAMFHLDGWDAVRKKIGTACKWTRVARAAADFDTTRANATDSRATGGAVANSTTRTIQEQVAAATAVAERMTVASLVAAPEQNNKDRSDHSETVPRGDAEKTAPAQPNKTDLLVYLLMARPEIKSVSDLTSRIIAIDDGYSASSGNIRTAIVAAGAPDVQVSRSQTIAIDRVISGEVPAAVLTVVSPEAAEGFPEIAGFKIFRIPLSPR